MNYEEEIGKKVSKLEEYTLIKTIGQGSFGKVIKGKHTKTGRTVAIKHIELKKKELSKKNYQKMLIFAVRELDILY
jgi:serine/threonine protein kinase